MLCPHCNSESPAHANFCMECGCVLAPHAPERRGPAHRRRSGAAHQRMPAQEFRAGLERADAASRARARDRAETPPLRREPFAGPRVDPGEDTAYGRPGGFSPMDRARFDYPRPRSGAWGMLLAVTGTGIVCALAAAVWMDPALSPEGAALMKSAVAAVGLDAPDGHGDAGAPFGTSPGELPYDGKAASDAPPTTADRAPSAQEGSSGAAQDGGGSAADDGEPQPPGDGAESLRVAESVRTSPAAAAPAKSTPAVKKPHPKPEAASQAARKKEIGRLRRQAERELGAE